MGHGISVGHKLYRRSGPIGTFSIRMGDIEELLSVTRRLATRMVDRRSLSGLNCLFLYMTSKFHHHHRCVTLASAKGLYSIGTQQS